MKTVALSISVILGFFTIYLCVRGAGAQWFEDPSKTFQNITFDMSNRASYNTSDCLFDMLQCWEAVRPDMICFYNSWFANMCSLMRDFCAESYGDQENYSKVFNMVSGMCYSKGDQEYS